MIKLFVSTPVQYNLTEKEIEEVISRYEELAHATEIKLGRYCEVEHYAVSYCSSGSKEDFIGNCLYDLRYANYAVFADKWETCDECVIMHKIAELIGIPILEL